ncbi:MAG: SDR family oxidoreductase [Vicinamibacterales bacterium]
MGRAMLLTGATGALGPHLLRELLQSDEFERIFVMVRPRTGSKHDPLERLEHALRQLDAGTGRYPLQVHPGRLIPLTGDVCQDDLGLDPELTDHLAREIDVILHAAANTWFTASRADLHEVNVNGTRHLLRLAGRCRHLRQVLLVSTACVAGTRAGTIAEEISDERPDFVNFYEETKWQAERLAALAELPVRIARLSTCIGDGQTGFVQRFGAIHHSLRWFMRGLLPLVPGADGSRLDLIPTDLAARWLARAAGQTVDRIEVCQVAAGHQAIPLTELLKFVVQHLRLGTSGWRGHQIEAPTIVDAATFEVFERTAVQSGDPLFGRVLESVRSFLPALLYPKVYQTHRAEACWGGPLPLGDWRSTLGNVIDFVAAHRRRTRSGAGVTYA